MTCLLSCKCRTGICRSLERVITDRCVSTCVYRENLPSNVRTSDGNVIASGVSGKIEFDTGDGNVTANNVHGDIRMHTGDGRIDGQGFDGSLDADTGDGNLRVDGRFDALRAQDRRWQHRSNSSETDRRLRTGGIFIPATDILPCNCRATSMQCWMPTPATEALLWTFPFRFLGR